MPTGQLTLRATVEYTVLFVDSILTSKFFKDTLVRICDCYMDGMIPGSEQVQILLSKNVYKSLNFINNS